MSLEALLENGAEFGSRLKSALDEVPPQKDGPWLGILDFEFLGSFEQPGSFGEIVLSGRAPGEVGGRDPYQPVYAFDFFRQSADCPITGLVLIKNPRSEMSAYKGNHFFMEGNLIGQAGEKGSGGFFALGFVHRRTDATILGHASGKRLS